MSDQPETQKIKAEIPGEIILSRNIMAVDDAIRAGKSGELEIMNLIQNMPPELAPKLKDEVVKRGIIETTELQMMDIERECTIIVNGKPVIDSSKGYYQKIASANRETVWKLKSAVIAVATTAGMIFPKRSVGDTGHLSLVDIDESNEEV